jgi:glutaryl-CoA dehydrogenase
MAVPTVFEPPDLFQLDDLLSAEDRALRQRVRDWVGTHYLPHIAGWNERAEFPLELALQIARFGAFGGNITGYGCAGLSPLQYGLVMQELERGDTGLRTLASVQGALAMNAIHMFGSEAQRERWLPAMAQGTNLGCFGLTEPDFGSNPAGMTTTATKTDRGYVLNGQKLWIGLATHADVAVIWAKVAGLPGVDPTSPRAIRGFLVEKGTPGFQPSLIGQKLSMRAALTCRIAFADCHLPEEALLPASNGLKSPLLCLNHARYGIAWGVLGAAAACYDEARQHALQRIQFGKPLASFQLVQRKLALMATELTKAQLLAFRLAQLKAVGHATHVQISIAKRNNVETALEIARTAREILGGIGILGEHQSFRHMNNLESVKTYEGTDDMHLLILGEHITGIPAFSG